jgi:hypothetical protein
MRVRRFELRLIAVALLVAWSVAAALVLLAYRPGGPYDLIVGLTAMTPIAIALAGVIWPPVARGDLAFPAMVALGVGALLCLVPSIAGVVTQLLAYGSQTLLPSAEAAYPWVLALLATSLFSAFGVARRLAGGTSRRRRRLLGGVAIAVLVTAVAGVAFATVAVANDLALGDDTVAASRFGPTNADAPPPACDGPLTAGTSARLVMHLSSTLDRRPLGTVELAGRRVGGDFRWLAYVASDRELGQYGEARVGSEGLDRPHPGRTGVPPTRPPSRPTPSTSRRSRRPSRPAIARQPRTAGSRSSKARARVAAGSPSTARSSLRPSRSRPGWSGRPTSTAGAGSSTTGCSPTASSARWRAA